MGKSLFQSLYMLQDGDTGDPVRSAIFEGLEINLSEIFKAV